jgi:hypothetical protein
LVAELKGLITVLRSKLQVAQDERRSVVAEHDRLAEEIKRLVKHAEEDRKLAAATIATLSADAAANVTEALRRAEDRHRVELGLAQARAAADLKVARLHLERSTALAGRLRLERDTARSDALRFNSERNELRAEIATLRTEHSQKAVRAASAVRLTFPGERPEQ